MNRIIHKGKYVLLIILAIYATLVASNFLKTSYSNLSELDQAILSELNVLFNSEEEKTMWDGYRLSDHAILSINKEGFLHHAYLINPKSEIQSLFVTEIQLPTDFSIKVYRISAVSPQMIPFLLPTNFNTIGVDYNLYGNNVYFFKYDNTSWGKTYDSSHYITFLSHEAFHYYMQNDWAGGERFDTQVLTEQDLNLMAPVYQVYEELLYALEQTPTNRETLMDLATQYVIASKARYQANPAYMKAESLTETAEGTATYIGLHSSRIVGYSFELMAVNGADNQKAELQVDLIVPKLKSGELSKSAIPSVLIYDTGALLCELLDALEVPNWQAQLNAQTKDSPITLFTLLADYVDNQMELH